MYMFNSKVLNLLRTGWQEGEGGGAYTILGSLHSGHFRMRMSVAGPEILGDTGKKHEISYHEIGDSREQ